MTGEHLTEDTQHLLRELAPQVLGVVARRHGDFAAAEDAVQEALIAAASQWPVAGIPTNPRGWLYQVAVRRLADHVRSERSRRRREEIVATEQWAAQPFAPPPDAELGLLEDDTLIVLFMCCHPTLTPSSAIALTLRAVGGLTTGEIARAFLVPEATMAQRISRAKQAIAMSGVAFSMPTDAERDARLVSVLHTLYLMFTEGYAASSGSDIHRTDLSNEAIRLARAVREKLPNDGEVAGLLALMLLTDARRAARVGADGELVPLDEQDRTLWNRAAIAEGVELVSRAMTSGPVGPYQLQAAISALHDEAAQPTDTDWPQILALYEVLGRLSDNPMVTLNQAIAAAMVHGPAVGLEMLAPLDDDARMRVHHRLDAVRAHLWERSGDRARAVTYYRTSALRTMNVLERNYLLGKALSCAAEAGAPSSDTKRTDPT